MFHPNQPAMRLHSQDSSVPMAVDEKETNVVVKDESQNGGFSKAESIVYSSKKLQDDLQSLGMKIKQHEDNIKSLKSQKNKLDESVVDLQVSIGKYQPEVENRDLSYIQSEEETAKQILRHEKSAAGILCQLISRHGTQLSGLTFTKDVLGIVATIGKVGGDNINRLFSEYLGLDSMLAVVCKTYEGVKALETYNDEGSINKKSGLHGLAASTGKAIDGRFRVICLENLRPYVGGLTANDPQRRLDLLKPRLPNGELPPGFIGFAVNMIDLDGLNLLCVTSKGYGLRETLLYHLFGRLQVYRTREEMLLAIPFISEGALSLDGGMIRSTGVFSLGDRVDVDVRFRKPSESSPREQEKDAEVENQIKEVKWKREKILEDMQRERQLLEHARFTFERKKQEFIKFLASNSSHTNQETRKESQFNSELDDYQLSPPTTASPMQTLTPRSSQTSRPVIRFLVPPPPSQSSQPSLSSAKTKNSRVKWTTAEEERLVHAWMKNVVDSRHVNGKKTGAYWEAVGNEVRSMRTGDDPDRSGKNCKDHWWHLNGKVSYFHSCWLKCAHNYKSGRSDDQLMADGQLMAQAETMYKQEQGHEFAWKHCWRLVKDHLKWSTRYHGPSDEHNKQSKKTRLDEVGSYTSFEKTSTDRWPTNEIQPESQKKPKPWNRDTGKATETKEEEELTDGVNRFVTSQAVAANFLDDTEINLKALKPTQELANPHLQTTTIDTSDMDPARLEARVMFIHSPAEKQQIHGA